MNEVERFRERREKRLKARGLRKDKEIEWITVKGVHVPLEDGIAVGTELKGKSFPNATPRGGKNENKRGQIDVSWVKNGSYPDRKEMDEWNRKALEEIEKETGYSSEKAKELQKTMIDYFGGDYAAYAKGEKKDEVDIVDAGLERMEKFEGAMYRGMSFASGNEDFERFVQLKEGDELKMRTISSWSSKKSVAENFGNLGIYKANSVVLICSNNRSAVGVQNISKWGSAEAEVLSPSSARWKVKSVKSMTQREYAEKFGFIEEYVSKNHPEYYDDYKVLYIEVEEI